MMLISNLAEAHRSSIAASLRQATLQGLQYKIFQMLIWIVMLAGSRFLKCITL